MAVAMPTSPHPAPARHSPTSNSEELWSCSAESMDTACCKDSQCHPWGISTAGCPLPPAHLSHPQLTCPASPAHLSHTPSPACPATPAHPAYTTVPALPASHPQLTGPTPPAHLPLLPFILLLLPEALNVLPLLSQGLVPELLLRTHLGSCLSHEFLEHNREGKRSC